MKWFPELRALALLRRIAIALEKANDLAEERMAWEHPAWGKATGKTRRPSKLFDTSVASIDEWNKQYRKARGEDD